MPTKRIMSRMSTPLPLELMVPVLVMLRGDMSATLL